jgi:hypothetical protein
MRKLCPLCGLQFLAHATLHVAKLGFHLNTNVAHTTGDEVGDARENCPD